MCNRSSVNFSQIVNVGDDIDLNIFMSHLITYVLNKYPNVSKTLFYLNIIIPTVVLIVAIIKMIICVEYMRFFSKIEIVHTQFLFAQTLYNPHFDHIAFMRTVVHPFSGTLGTMYRLSILL